MKKLVLTIGFLLLLSIGLYTQGTGTPSTLRVKVDTTGALAIDNIAAPIPPYTFPIFNNARLKVDSNGNIVVACADCGSPTNVSAEDVTPGAFSSLGVYSFVNGLEAYQNNNAANAEGVMIGPSAGLNDVTNSIDIGFFAGGGALGSGGVPTGVAKVNVGRQAGFSATGDNSVNIGHAAGQYAYDGASSVIIGYLAARNGSQNASVHNGSSVIIGTSALENGVSNQAAVVLGPSGGKGCTDAVGFVGVGANVGENATNCRQSVYLGYTAGRNLNASRRLVIETDDTLAPVGTSGLIYGEFDNRVLNFNAATGFRWRMESVTTTKVPAILESAEFYYTGDTNGQAITLVDNPDTLGAYWQFVVTQTQASNSLSIAPNTGETLRDGTNNCSTFTATAIGATASIMVTATGSGGHFTVINKLGTWTCNP